MSQTLDPTRLMSGDVVVYGPLGLGRVERVDLEGRELVIALARASILVPFASEAARYLREPAGVEEARACLAALLAQAPDPRSVIERLPHLKHTNERGSLLQQSEVLGQLYAAADTPGLPDAPAQARFAELLSTKVFEEIGHALGRTHEDLDAEVRRAFAARGARVPVETPLYEPPSWPQLTCDAPNLEGHRSVGSFLATEQLLVGDPLQMDQRPGQLAAGSDLVVLVAPLRTLAGIWHAYQRIGTDGSLQALALVHQTRAGDLLRTARRATRHAVVGVGSNRVCVMDGGVVQDARVHECLRYANPKAYPWGVVQEARATGAHLVFVTTEDAGATYAEIFLARDT